MTADTLSTASRRFYEYSRFKVCASIVLGATALTFLGFASEAGGMAQSVKLQVYDSEGNLLIGDYGLRTAMLRLAGGYGFGAFCHFAAFAIALAAGFILSPGCCGSPNESKTVLNPLEIQPSSSAVENLAIHQNSPAFDTSTSTVATPMTPERK